MNIEIGQFMDLEQRQKNSRNTIKYKSKVIDVFENCIYLAYPIQQSNGKTKIFPLGTRFSVSFIDKNEEIYQFHTEIIKKRTKPIPGIMIAIPEDDKLNRIQRRKFARLEIVVDVAVHSEDGSFLPFTTVTADFSGGGIAFIIPRNIDVHHGPVTIWMSLPYTDGNIVHLKLQGDIVRVADGTKGGIRTASVAFKNLTKKEEQTIIRYCFEKQREERRKELM
ncbi:flagellar brake domain-containing protein [Virgibacillus sp. 179-BFC.A HS]|uniref:Flagellar brake domain-containing protein n=1 Tax=Tigheibacillus jepli TaxID=3035914 RepID=A0ABU5CI89_9BACI|nr:flagellar brake domain-containing protein [Virgibacillus sp. 179-BFC.A HS]MDY0405686.1 flagellar brake domain-containing protein [Virgibacillus sp. 179-BFC.A HS]